MNTFKYHIEELDNAIDYVKNNDYSISMSDMEETYYNASIRSIRGDIKVANRYILDNL